jgi:ABC-type amino acid transport substrate-binding protein
VLRELPAGPPPLPRSGATLLEAVRARGRLRVGYLDDQMPYSYFNARGELVGFDVEMARLLAEELGVALEFVPVTRDRMDALLEAGVCDLVMSGVLVTTRRAARTVFAPSYLDETLAFVVADHRRSEFLSEDKVHATPGLRVGVPDLPYLLQLVHREFPGIEVVPVMAKEVNDFFAGRSPHLDALALTAERGSFLTLLHPAFSVAVPHPLAVRIPLAYPVARHDLEFARFLGTWIDLKRKDGTIDELYGHWILGRTAQPPKPRWSMIRNVLHWVD